MSSLFETLGQIDAVILKCLVSKIKWMKGLGGQWRQALFIAFGMYLTIFLFFKNHLHCTNRNQQPYTNHWVAILCSGYWPLREQSLQPESGKGARWQWPRRQRRSQLHRRWRWSPAPQALWGKRNGVKRGWRYSSKFSSYLRWSTIDEVQKKCP